MATTKTKKQIFQEKQAQEAKQAQDAKLAEQLKNVTGSVQFNNDSSVTVDGKKLSRDEYKDFKDKSKSQYQGGGEVLASSQTSSNVSDLLREQYKGILNRNLTLSADKQALFREVRDQEKQRQGLIPTAQTDTAMTSQETLPQNADQTNLQTDGTQNISDFVKEKSPAIKAALSPIDLAEAFVYGDRKKVENLTFDSAKALGGIASIYYQLKSQGKPLKQQDFESALTDERKDIMKYIEYASQGLMSPYEVQKKIDSYNDVLSEYESWNKAEGKLNIRYLILQGSDTQRAIQDGYDDVKTFRLLLENAALQGITKQQAIENELALQNFNQK